MAFYDAIPASDGTSLVAPPNAEFKVFEVTDTARANPLPLRTVAGTNAAPLVTTAQGVVPPVEVVSPNFEHIFQSGEWEWRRESSEGMRKATEEARAAAVLVQQRVESGELKGSPGDAGPRGLPGVNAVPASEAVATYAKTPGNPVNLAIGAAAARQGAATVQHGREAESPRPQAGQVTWIGWVRPANMDTRDVWLEIDEPPFSLENSINWMALWTTKSAGQSLTDGQEVSSWGDASGNGVKLTRADAVGATKLPVYRASVAEFGGKPALEFSGSPLGGTLAAVPQPCTAVFLARHTKTASSMIGPLPNFYRATAGSIRASAGDVLDLPGSSNTQAHLFIAEFNGTASTISAGPLVATGKAGTKAFGGTVYLGGHDAGSHMGGYIAFGGVVRGLLDAKTKADLVAWVTKEYGVAG